MPSISRWCIDYSIMRWYHYEKSRERRRRDAARRKSLDQRGDVAGRKRRPSMHHNCILWIRSECARCTGFVVSWISVYSSEHNVHKEDRNALGYTSLHSCTRWRAILVTAWQPSTRRLLDVCHPNMKRNLDSISLGSALSKSGRRTLQSSKRALHGLRKAFKPVGHYYLCHVHGIFMLLLKSTIQNRWSVMHVAYYEDPSYVRSQARYI